MRQVGGSLGIALMGAIVASAITTTPPKPDEFLTGFHHALETATVIALAGAAIAALTLRKASHAPEPAQTPAGVEVA
jgi:hypothetical protein